MRVYNVLAAVNELIQAESEQEAIAILYARLTDAGFDTFENADHHGDLPSAFESEELDDATMATIRADAVPPVIRHGILWGGTG